LAASIDAPCLAANPSTPGSCTSRLLAPFLAVSRRSCTLFLPVNSNVSKMLGFGGLRKQVTQQQTKKYRAEHVNATSKQPLTGPRSVLNLAASLPQYDEKVYHYASSSYLGAGAGFSGAATGGGFKAALAAAEKVFRSMALKRERRSFSFFATAAEIMRFCSRSAD